MKFFKNYCLLVVVLGLSLDKLHAQSTTVYPQGIAHVVVTLSFEGYLSIDTPGEYTFYTQSDDGSQLFIGTQKVVDNNGSHGVIERSGSIKLEKGRHPIKILYFNEAGGFWLDALYKGPGLTKQIIPADKLFLNWD